MRWAMPPSTYTLLTIGDGLVAQILGTDYLHCGWCDRLPVWNR
ncbi:hypothetical protein ACNKHW_11845 [Shigella flexneri]